MYHDLHHGPERYTTDTLFPLLDRLSAFDAEFYVPSHHDEPLTRAQFVEEATVLRAIGRTVAEHGPDREAVLDALPERLETIVNDSHRAITDAFIAGLRLPTVESVL